MNRTQKEVAQKNANIDHLNARTNNAYVYQTSGTLSGADIARAKQEDTTPSDIPGEVKNDSEKERKQNWKIAAMAILAVAFVVALLKLKIIKI